MHQRNATYFVTLVTVVLLATMVSCSRQEERQSTVLDQHYRIDPITLLDSLKNHDVSAFTPSKEEPDLLPREQQITVNWLQADYFYIADNLHQRVFGESLQGWQLSSMDFRLDCSQVINGFQNGRFTFFKVVNEKEESTRMSSFIDVDPRGNFVFLDEEKYYPKLVDWEVIDIARLKVSAEKALQMAESNGGNERRKSVENACYISLVLSPSPARDSGWVVRYTQHENVASFFSVLIDPYTGEVTVQKR